jgi:hypothetical protein
MTLSSYSDVFSIDHDRGYDEELHVGDTVRCGTNHFPHFEVIFLSGDKAWLRNISNGQDSIASVSRCRRIEQAMQIAAE